MFHHRPLSLALSSAFLAPLAAAQTVPVPLFIDAQPSTEQTVLAVVSDGARGVFLAGETSVSVAGPNQGGVDALIQRRTSDNQVVWSLQFGGPGDDRAEHAVEDGAGGLVVVGDTTAGGGSGARFITRYDGAGQVLWTQTFGSASLDRKFVTRTSSGEYLVVVGAPTFNTAPQLTRFDAAGNILWTRSIPATASGVPWSMAPDGNDGAYISFGVFGGLFTQDMRVVRFNAQGIELWRRLSANALSVGFGLSPDGNGGVVGAISGSTEQYLSAWDASGNRYIHSVLPNESFGFEQIRHVPGLGTYIAATLTQDPVTNLREAFLGFHDLAGTLVWSVPLDNPVIGASVWSNLVRDELGGLWFSSPRPLTTRVVRFTPPAVGLRTCTPATPNSTGQPAELRVVGSEDVALNGLTLLARALPQSSFGYFQNASALGNSTPAGSQGTQCLAGSIGRYNRAQDVRNAGSSGSLFLELDLSAMPTPAGPVSALAGQTWHFQAWFRDANPTPTSNFTDAISVTLQ